MGADDRAPAGPHAPAPDAECPLCPSRPGSPTEIPARDYEVAVFQNRFPALSSPGPAGEPGTGPGTGTGAAGGLGLLRRAPGRGRCEVAVFSPGHGTSFADLRPA